ncbi:MAG: hypothetical protein IPK26_27840 [Planctomycetes bacterium]|nr:hypothetical protein [Planctomycetota bacterium]
MRRRTLQRLANLGRLALLAVVVAAAATAWVWSYRPTWVDSLDAWLIRKARGTYEQRLNDALAIRQPQECEAALERLAADLHFVKRQDHLAYVATQCLVRLSELRDQAGDLAAATEWMSEAVAFDDHNLRSLVRLHELRCRRPETQKQGDEDLASLWAQFPGSPWVAPAYIQRLASTGQGEGALDAIEKAIGAIESNLWTFVWDPGPSPDGKPPNVTDGLDRGTRRADIMPTIEDGVLRVRFCVNEPCAQVRWFLPPFCSFGLVQPRLRMLSPGKYHEIDLAADNGESVHLRRSEGRIDTFGESGPWLTVKLPERLPPMTIYEFSGRFEPTHSALLLAPLRGPAFAPIEQALLAAKADAKVQRLRELRGLALGQATVQVFWRTAAADFGSQSSRPVALGLRIDGGAPVFSTTVRIDAPATQIRIDLPENVGIRYRLDDLTLMRGGQTVALEPGKLEFAFSNDLQRDGNELLVTGSDPYFGFAVPAGDGTIESVTFRGGIR